MKMKNNKPVCNFYHYNYLLLQLHYSIPYLKVCVIIYTVVRLCEHVHNIKIEFIGEYCT